MVTGQQHDQDRCEGVSRYASGGCRVGLVSPTLVRPAATSVSELQCIATRAEITALPGEACESLCKRLDRRYLNTSHRSCLRECFH